jgi:hypothetical protein
MGSNVVNLNRFRKKKQREEATKRAEANRILHGRTKAEKERALADRERAARALEGKRLESHRSGEGGGESSGAGLDALEEPELGAPPGPASPRTP